MPEIRCEIPADELVILDGYIQAGGASDRTRVIRDLLAKWAKDQLHISTIVCRMARINPMASEADRPSDGT